MSVETEYRGYVIRWSDNGDEWACYDVNYSSPKLSAVKQKIDAVERLHRKMRQPALLIEYSGEVKDCVIVSIDENRDACWITTDQVGTDRWGRPKAGTFKREKADIKKLAADTPENRALAERLREAVVALGAATVARKEAGEAIPRLTRELIVAGGVEAET